MRRYALLVVAAFALFFTYGCGSGKNPSAPIDPEGAATEAQAGDQALAGGDIAGANQHYRNALAKDPNNAQANIGAAVTELYMVQSDPQVDSLVRELGGPPPPTPLRGSSLESSRSARLLQRLGLSGNGAFDPIANGQLVGRAFLRGAEDPPMLSRVQQIIKIKVMPKIQYVEHRLNLVESHPEWRYFVPPAVSDAADTLELDLGEVYALDALVNSVQGWLGILVAYNFDVPAPFDSVDAESLLTAGTDFGTLWLDGRAQLSAAHSNFMASKTRLDQAIAFINAETDDQADDVIPKAALQEPGFLSFKEDFDKVHTSLSTPVDVEVRNYQGQPMTIQILIGNFFTNPIQDWKTKLPDHTFSNHEPVITDPITFPDPLFNGIYPGMTNETWRAIIGPVNPPPVAPLARR